MIILLLIFFLFFYDHFETIPQKVTKSDPFDDYLKVLQEKGYFNGTEPNTPPYNERLDKARAKWQENIDKKRQAAVELKDQGNLLFKEGNFEGSIELYSQAIKSDPTNPHYFSNRGLAYSKLKKFDLSVQDYKSSLAIDDTQVKIYLRLGNTLTELGRQEEAIETYRKGLVVDPTNEDLLRNIDTILAKVAESQNLTQPSFQPPPGFDVDSMMNNPAIAENIQQMAQIAQNPEFLQMASNLMNDPSFKNLMSGMLGSQFQ